MSLPSGLQHLTFGGEFNQSLNNVSLSSGLQIFSCGDVDWTIRSPRPAVLDVASHACPRTEVGVLMGVGISIGLPELAWACLRIRKVPSAVEQAAN